MAPTSTTPAFHPLIVADVERLCNDAVAVTFEVPAELAADYSFRAGQWVTLRRIVDGCEERRSYSICAPEDGPLRIALREIPGGRVSGWLVRDVRPGDRVEVGTPAGTFILPGATAGHHVLVGAGSGITPLLSIAATVLRDPATTVTVLYGNRRTDTVMCLDEVADLKDRYPPRVQLVHVLSREPRDVELCTGRLDAKKITALLALLPDVERVDHWWLCGPFGMVADARAVLAEAGVPTERIHVELFFVEAVPPDPVRHSDRAITGDTSAVTVILDGRATTTTVPRDTPILDGAQRTRRDLPFSCKGGVCGTCRAQVTAGAVDLRRNFALEQSELDAGFILTCQSTPVSDAVTVDFDASLT